MTKCPIQLIKRLSDGPTGEIRFQIEVPERFIDLAHQFEKCKDSFFMAVGPVDSEEEIIKALKAGTE